VVGRPHPPLPFPAALTGAQAEQNLNSITAPGIEAKARHHHRTPGRADRRAVAGFQPVLGRRLDVAATTGWYGDVPSADLGNEICSRACRVPSDGCTPSRHSPALLGIDDAGDVGGVQQGGTSRIPVQGRLDLPAPGRRVSHFGRGLRRGAGETRARAAGRGQRYSGSGRGRHFSAKTPAAGVGRCGCTGRSSRPDLALPPTGLPAVCALQACPAVNRTPACEMPGRRQRRGQPLVTAHLTDKTSSMR
jgi:hypothetical protein